MSASRPLLRTGAVALRAMAVLTLVLGIGYTLVLTGIGQLALPAQANGSLITENGRTVGSALIGQSFAGQPRYFQSRPSAAGKGDDGASSGATNLGPNNPALVDAIRARQAQLVASDGVSVEQIPADAVTSSASGLDPDISPANALLQVDRVARVRGVSADRVRRLVESMIQSRDVGFLGDPRVNVLKLNLALDRLGS